MRGEIWPSGDREKKNAIQKGQVENDRRERKTWEMQAFAPSRSVPNDTENATRREEVRKGSRGAARIP